MKGFSLNTWEKHRSTTVYSVSIINANGKKYANKKTSAFNVKSQAADTMGISTVSGFESASPNKMLICCLAVDTKLTVESRADGKIVQNKREDELGDIGSIASDGLSNLLNCTEHMKGRDTDKFSHSTKSEFSAHSSPIISIQRCKKMKYIMVQKVQGKMDLEPSKRATLKMLVSLGMIISNVLICTGTLPLRRNLHRRGKTLAKKWNRKMLLKSDTLLETRRGVVQNLVHANCSCSYRNAFLLHTSHQLQQFPNILECAYKYSQGRT
ncbi:hypothetical protein SUGI_0201380 [Cryptomeria japonica]|nr:hypothetical protein SUGI_0201380 [Cryptomeria japonica]